MDTELDETIKKQGVESGSSSSIKSGTQTDRQIQCPFPGCAHTLFGNGLAYQSHLIQHLRSHPAMEARSRAVSKTTRRRTYLYNGRLDQFYTCPIPNCVYTFWGYRFHYKASIVRHLSYHKRAETDGISLQSITLPIHAVVHRSRKIQQEIQNKDPRLWNENTFQSALIHTILRDKPSTDLWPK